MATAALLVSWSYAAVQPILRYVVLAFLAYMLAGVLARPVGARCYTQP